MGFARTTSKRVHRPKNGREPRHKPGASLAWTRSERRAKRHKRGENHLGDGVRADLLARHPEPAATLGRAGLPRLGLLWLWPRRWRLAPGPARRTSWPSRT